MTVGLTVVQSKLLEYLKRYIVSHNGVPPTYDEMAAAMGLHSKSGIARIVEGLEKRGFVRRHPHAARSIEIIDDDVALPSEETMLLLLRYCRETGILMRTVVDDALREYFRAHPANGGRR